MIPNISWWMNEIRTYFGTETESIQVLKLMSNIESGFETDPMLPLKLNPNQS